LLSAVVVIGLVPNMEGLASFVVVASALFFAAAWVTTGSSRISYVGLQVALVVSLVLLNQPGQTTSLAPAGDRVLGVLIGITMMGFIDLALWPNFGDAAAQPQGDDASQQSSRA